MASIQKIRVDLASKFRMHPSRKRACEDVAYDYETVVAKYTCLTTSTAPNGATIMTLATPPTAGAAARSRRITSPDVTTAPSASPPSQDSGVPSQQQATTSSAAVGYTHLPQSHPSLLSNATAAAIKPNTEDTLDALLGIASSTATTISQTATAPTPVAARAVHVDATFDPFATPQKPNAPPATSGQQQPLWESRGNVSSGPANAMRPAQNINKAVMSIDDLFA